MSEIQHILDRALTVRDLIQQLEDMPPDARVVIEMDYGDRQHTMQALPVQEAAQLEHDQPIYATAYSHSGIAIGEPDPNGRGEFGLDVVILRN